ncbi:MAG: hypothetical protein ACTS6P_00310 [Candidatus Hodgkinia cicadicola]
MFENPIEPAGSDIKTSEPSVFMIAKANPPVEWTIDELNQTNEHA